MLFGVQAFRRQGFPGPEGRDPRRSAFFGASDSFEDGFGAVFKGCGLGAAGLFPFAFQINQELAET